MFSEPTACRPLDDVATVVELWFKDGKDDDNAPRGRFLMRGGVCWPIPSPDPKAPHVGYVMALGVNLTTERAYVFDETPFVTVEHVVDPRTGRIIYPGLAPWFSRVWTKLLCDTFYCNQDEATCLRFERSVRHAVQIQPVPRFVPVEPWDGIHSAEGLLWEWIERRSISWFADGKLCEDITRYPKATAAALPASMHALTSALSGIATMLASAKAVAAEPQAAMRPFLGNLLMRDNSRDWHSEERQA